MVTRRPLVLLNGQMSELPNGDKLVGLDLVDNTNDVSKPVSIAQQSVLSLKANTANPALTGTATIRGSSPGLRIGRIDGTAFTPYIDFNSSGLATAASRDARIIASNGTASAEQGTLTYNAATHAFSSRPLFAGNTAWDSGNLNPASYSPKANPVFTGTQSVEKLAFNNQMFVENVTDSITGSTRIQIYRNTASNTNFTDVYLYKDSTNATVGTAGTVSSMLRIEQIVGAASTFQWPLLVKATVNGAGAGSNHVSITAQTYKNAESGIYGFCAETRCGVVNTTTASVSFELDIFGKGADNNGNRVGLDCVYGSQYPLQAGDNVVSYGLRISPLQNISDWTAGQVYPDGVAASNGRAILGYGLQIKGNVGCGIDLSNMKNTYSDTAMIFSDSLKLKWVNGGAIGFTSEKFTIAMPAGGLSAGTTMPTSTVARLKVNVSGYGDAYIPIIA